MAEEHQNLVDDEVVVEKSTMEKELPLLESFSISSSLGSIIVPYKMSPKTPTELFFSDCD
jgi:hypothetical protein